jgi:hypothetical protein
MSNKEQNYPITSELVSNIRHRLSFGLTKGLGTPEDGKMCIEALICAAYGWPHSDRPPCVGETFRRAKISLNDCDWSSNEARAKGMEKLAIAQLGSNILDQVEAEERLFHKSCQKLLPLIIDSQIADPTQKKRIKNLENWILKFKNSTIENCENLWIEFYYNYCNCNNNYYNNNYYNYNYYYNNNSYNYNYYSYYNDNNYGIKIPNFLEVVAETILEVLQDMKSPGCEWLEK